MGPGAAGLNIWGAPPGAPRWKLRLERVWGVPLHAARERPAGLDRLLDPLEAGLREIDFPKVTVEDQVTYLEHAVGWQVRRALRAGRFDLALEIRSHGARRIAELRYSFTSIAMVSRRSTFARSGAQPATTDPGAPWFPPGGVTPPGPEK